ncbi:hypothetical protein PFISCL1PPCAC_18403, partial [Pristionchus fissidentatus]
AKNCWRPNIFMVLAALNCLLALHSFAYLLIKSKVSRPQYVVEIRRIFLTLRFFQSALNAACTFVQFEASFISGRSWDPTKY